MSEEEKAVMLMRMVDECKTVRSNIVGLRAKAREIGTALIELGNTLNEPTPSAELIEKHGISVIPAAQILELANEIKSSVDRRIFLEKELRAANISVSED